jgi:hypothetical protein
MVKQAQVGRAELMKTAIAAAQAVANLFKPV